MAQTSIEWTDATWNPLRGCRRVSPGCENCYAERIAARFSGPGQPYEGLARMTKSGPRWTGRIQLVEDKLDEPLRWRKPRMVFVNSMSDLFHEDVPDYFLDKVFATMLACHFFENKPDHVFQILTKRPERMLRYFCSRTPVQHLKAWAEAGDGWIQTDNEDEQFSEAVQWHCSAKWDPETRVALTEPASWSRPENLWPLPNVWLGVSVEDQKTADERIPLLLQTPAAVRFVSAEPLLGPVDLTRVVYDHTVAIDSLNGLHGWPIAHADCDRLDWVIVGGESGPGARPMHPDWARMLRDQCVAAGVPFLFKQWGEWLPNDQEYGCYQPAANYERKHVLVGGVAMARVGKKAAGATLDGREWREFPQVKGAKAC